MKEYKPRIADEILEAKLDAMGAVLIEGPKYCGKTTLGSRHAKSILSMSDPDTKDQNMIMAQTNISRLLQGSTPRLIDEWQIAPQFWDAVRNEVDKRGEDGQFILTGSAVPPKNDQIFHTGTGRMAWLRLRTMSLWESGESSGGVSLRELFDSDAVVDGKNEIDLAELAFITCRGGWPKAVLAKSTGEITDYQELIRQTQLEMSFISGKLSATERELAETRSQLEVTRQTAGKHELEAADAKKQLTSLQGVLKKAVNDLSEAKSEVKDLRGKEEEFMASKEQLAQLQGEVKTSQAELDAARERLAKAEADLRSDVYEHYSDAVRKLSVHLAERRTLVDHRSDFSFYLPEVELDGRRFLISELLSVTDMGEINTPYSRIYELGFAVDKDRGVRHFYSVNADPRLVLLEVDSVEGGKALPVIRYSELKKRGLHDLYLFRKGALGSESAPLAERVSMDMVGEEPYLYVRNSTSRSNSELKAETGDFILTKQGEFVGVVVALENFDLNSKQEARVALFPDNFKLDALTEVPLNKQGEYFAGFIAGMEELFRKVQLANRVQRVRK